MSFEDRNHLAKEIVYEKGDIKEILSILLKRDFLYKYKEGNENDFDSIRNDYMWIPNVICLNDPCDSTFEIDVASLYSSYEKKAIREKRLTQSKGKFSKMVKNYKDNFRKSSFVGALTESEKNMMLWAHYADKHKGICLAYDVQDIVDALRTYTITELKSQTALLAPVYYCDEIMNVNSIEQLAESYKCYFIKKEEWSGEKEWRIIITTFEKYFESSFEKYGVPKLDGIVLSNLRPKKIYVGYKDNDKFEKLKPICKEKDIALYRNHLKNKELVSERII